ncbi:YceI family protein [Lignipirellula cremea]|uniref:YceI family protein n=1 Tax=Lignipirellula cremea TaxID=2528010 RepID=UPI001E31A1CC|nr:YceI family protein [Lignipirellula cremea]
MGDLHLGSSRVYIHVFKTGFGHEHGVAGRLKAGHLNLENGSSGRLVFDMLSFDADGDDARRYVGLTGSTDADTRQQVNANMHGASILDTRTHPTATFAIKTATKTSENSSRGLPVYQLDGDFTLHGVTHPIRILADSEAKPPWIHLRGSFAILQSQYGITPFSKAFGAVGVADRLEIYGDLWIAAQRLAIPPSSQR